MKTTKYNANLKDNFRTYLIAKGYYARAGTLIVSENGIQALIPGYDVLLKDFTQIKRSGADTWVRLSKKDFSNEILTDGLFQITA